MLPTVKTEPSRALGPRGLHAQVVELLGLRITTGEVPAGGQIVPEEIARVHAVSRTVVREALKVLEAKGLVWARPKTGTKVRGSRDWNLLDPDVIRWRAGGPDGEQQLADLLGLRGAVEPLAARGCCARAEGADLDALQSACSDMAAAVEAQDWEAFTTADVRFHRRLLASCGNTVIRQLADPIEAALWVRHRLRLIPHELDAAAVTVHLDILGAVRAGDEGGAELASRRIVDKAGAEIWASLHPEQADSAPAPASH